MKSWCQLFALSTLFTRMLHSLDDFTSDKLFERNERKLLQLQFKNPSPQKGLPPSLLLSDIFFLSLCNRLFASFSLLNMASLQLPLRRGRTMFTSGKHEADPSTQNPVFTSLQPGLQCYLLTGSP